MMQGVPAASISLSEEAPARVMIRSAAAMSSGMLWMYSRISISGWAFRSTPFSATSSGIQRQP